MSAFEDQITERQFSYQVEDLFHTFGWRYSHSRPAMTTKGWRTALTGDKGFPDYVAVKGARQIFAELKSDTGQLSGEQKKWLYALAQVPGNEVFIWRPKAWGGIVAILKGEPNPDVQLIKAELLFQEKGAWTRG